MALKLANRVSVMLGFLPQMLLVGLPLGHWLDLTFQNRLPLKVTLAELLSA